ncbi:MAG: radical SAM protein [Phycisphaerae bacterium]
MSVSVYLADLRHNFSGVLANDCMPLCVGYLKAVMDRDLPEARSRLFAYPERLQAAVEDEPPDVLMLSNYMWNEMLSFSLAKHAKRVHPETLVVMGGPNFPLGRDRRIDFVRRHPEIDVYILGEADFLATEVTKRFLAVGKSLKRFDDQDLPSCVRRRTDGELVISEMWDRQRNIEEIPSPWLTGILDEFFDGKLAPLFETNRGCPFTCTFCVQGTTWYSKVNYFPVERLAEEMDYIGARIHEQCHEVGTLRIADSNYGMFRRDTEISRAIGKSQKRYGWPTYIDATTGKNRADLIIQSLEEVNGAMAMYQAVQSFDDETLKTVKRSNIKKDAYEKIMVHIRGRGLRSISDMILGLPGETIKSHISGIHQLLDAGTHEMHNFQSMMLKGSEMETPDARKEHQFQTRFRVLPKNFGEYGGEKVFDVDEIVVGTKTMPFDDYLQGRKYHMALTIYWNHSWFEDVVLFVEQFGIKRSEWMDAVRAAMDRDKGVVGRLLAEFVTETKSELFLTYEACEAFYSQPENFDQLRRGEIGDNLMYKYRALASFYEWPDICRMAFEVSWRLLESRGVTTDVEDFEAFWHDFHRFVELGHAHGRTTPEILAPVRTDMHYHIQRWIDAGMPGDPGPYRLSQPCAFDFALSSDNHREMADALEVWSARQMGLSKMVTRIRPAAQDRECHAVDALAVASNLPVLPSSATEEEAHAA